jgi:hypothetical protein
MAAPELIANRLEHYDQRRPMLFPQRLWSGLVDGTVTVAFRRWKRPTVKAGGTLQSPGGLLGIDEVAPIEPHDVTDDDARAAGYESRDEALAADRRQEGVLYRVRFHRIGEDPRAALRARDDLGAAEIADVRTALRRLDWAIPTLRLIADHPATVSTELAATAGVERQRFKLRVRRLKALGLTESLETGYRLSPRGQAFLAGVDRSDGPPT